MKLLTVTLCALLCSGCFVFDEIQKGREIMEAHTPDDQRSGAPKEAAKAPGGASTARERLAEYYAGLRAKAAAPSPNTDPADDVGRCRIGNSTQFTRRSDCRLRGGTFL